MAMVVLALLTIPVLLFLTWVFDYLPEATLAAVVFVIAVHLLKIDTLRMLYRLPARGEFWVAVSTAAIVALVGVGAGILWAVVASIVLHLTHTVSPQQHRSDGRGRDRPRRRAGRARCPDPAGTDHLPVRREPLLRQRRPPGRGRARPRGGRRPDPVRLFVLDASEIHRADWTSAESLRKAISIVHEAGAEFQIARLPAEARPIARPPRDQRPPRPGRVHRHRAQGAQAVQGGREEGTERALA